MSYIFNATNERLTGSFTTTFVQPLTMALWSKIPSYPTAARTALSFGFNNGTSVDHSFSIRADNGVVHQYEWFNRDTLTRNVNRVTDITGVWAAIVGVTASSTSRIMYVQTSSNASSEGTTSCVPSPLQFIRVGENAAAGQDWGGELLDYKLAEIAIWDTVLSIDEIDDYMNGVSASVIAPADLRGYWPLSASNATQANEGLDATGDLTVTGATFDSDHPTITIPSAGLYIPGQRIYLLP